MRCRDNLVTHTPSQKVRWLEQLLAKVCDSAGFGDEVCS